MILNKRKRVWNRNYPLSPLLYCKIAVGVVGYYKTKTWKCWYFRVAVYCSTLKLWNKLFRRSVNFSAKSVQYAFCFTRSLKQFKYCEIFYNTIVSCSSAFYILYVHVDTCKLSCFKIHKTHIQTRVNILPLTKVNLIIILGDCFNMPFKNNVYTICYFSK